MMVRRRYEILLPLQFNDGQTVPETLLWETVEQLETLSCIVVGNSGHPRHLAP